jgi:hypothetical protein
VVTVVSVDHCAECGEPVPEDDAVEVVDDWMPTETGLMHSVCWDTYEEQSKKSPVGFAAPRWVLKPKPGVP